LTFDEWLAAAQPIDRKGPVLLTGAQELLFATGGTTWVDENADIWLVDVFDCGTAVLWSRTP